MEARDAFARNDVEGSVLFHQDPLFARAPEVHKTGAGKYLKSIVFGGLDGIITTFAIVAGIAGAGLDPAIVIVMGFANLLADGMSMGIGDYLSERAEYSYNQAERAREEWETENYIEGEKAEMVELYQEKGLPAEDAQRVVDIISRHKEFFIDVMMVQELGIMFDPEESPFKHGLVTFLSFIVFGFVPLAVYLVLVFFDEVNDHSGFDLTFTLAGIMSALCLFLLGVLKSKFTSQKWWLSGLIVLFYGGAAALAAFGIGSLLGLFLDVDAL
eukprot:TRINITY_DN2728_c0_g1_i1.p1 TRINITY_DN2728_c0_g1~~TRINITY_DN2728_c0_g1_i1.p1  ORF type:complete len:281 (+),score=54.94 TRINITY_DN2728_c0_g1_i1:31-843(+)